MDEREKIHLGVVLAGAVTAGAFTAGVMDYLINTLKNWEIAYKKDNKNVPRPNIVIDVLTGASAGSIAAAVTALGLATNNLPYVEDVKSTSASDNILFDTWVNLGLNKNQKVLEQLLSTSDIKRENGEEVLRSLLNTTFIENMMHRLVDKVSHSYVYDLPKFIDQNLEVLMTLSNLRGLSIDLSFSNKKNVGHTMSYHKAYALFEFGKMHYDHSYEADKLPFDIKNKEHLKLFLNCARASGAFPIGLKSIPFYDIPNEYIKANIKRLFGRNNNIEPRLDKELYKFIAVDGGMTNNEPLAEALKSLKSKGDKYKMILVDPFPSHISEHENLFDIKKDSIFTTIPQLYRTLRNQATFKESDIVDLFSENTNNHMIWPTRYDSNGKSLPNAIACGALSGFAGFLSREFRVHDYRLGQKNAQSFVRKYFMESIKDESRYPKEFIDRFAIKCEDEIKVPIIPDYTIVGKEVRDGRKIFTPTLEDELVDFPKINLNPIIYKAKPELEKRVRKVIDLSFEQLKNKKSKNQKKEEHQLIRELSEQPLFKRIKTFLWKRIGNLLMNTVGKNMLKKTITDKILITIIKELDKYKLIK